MGSIKKNHIIDPNQSDNTHEKLLSNFKWDEIGEGSGTEMAESGVARSISECAQNLFSSLLRDINISNYEGAMFVVPVNVDSSAILASCFNDDYSIESRLDVLSLIYAAFRGIANTPDTCADINRKIEEILPTEDSRFYRVADFIDIADNPECPVGVSLDSGETFSTEDNSKSVIIEVHIIECSKENNSPNSGD
jgi:hypothetical protein